MNMPSVTVGVVPRERFTLQAKCIKRILENTSVPFKLVVVDCNSPDRYRKELEDVVKGHGNVTIIRRDHFLTVNQARNLIIKACKDDYLCLMENDCMVYEGWLKHMINACENFPAMACSPLLLEGIPLFRIVHHDPGAVHIKSWEESGKVYSRMEADKSVKKWKHLEETTKVDVVEGHCTLFRREFFDKFGPLDENITVRLFIDVVMQLHRAGMNVVVEPKAVVRFYAPPPVKKEDMEFFKFIWNTDLANPTEDYLLNKWNLQGMPSAVEWIRGQHERISWARWIKYRIKDFSSRILKRGFYARGQ